MVEGVAAVGAPARIPASLEGTRDMPRPADLTDEEYARYERCVKELKKEGKVDSPYAVCLEAIRKGRGHGGGDHAHGH